MCFSSHTHKPSHVQSSVEITGGVKTQAAQVSAWNKLIPADEEAKSGSVKTFSLDACPKVKILGFIGKLVDAKHPLRDIEQHHGDQLLRLF